MDSRRKETKKTQGQSSSGLWIASVAFFAVFALVIALTVNRLVSKRAIKQSSPVSKTVPRNTDLYNVTRIVDGDTIHISNGSGIELKVRLVDIDAPESGQPQYHESKNYLADLLRGKSVTVKSDSTDKYGRQL